MKITIKVRVGCISQWRYIKNISLDDEIDLFDTIQETIIGYIKAINHEQKTN